MCEDNSSADRSGDRACFDQGDEGERFYIIESGLLRIFVKTEGVTSDDLGSPGKEASDVDLYSTHPSLGKYVKQLGTCEGFGELALMYDTPRAATVTCKENGAVQFVSENGDETVETDSCTVLEKCFQHGCAPLHHDGFGLRPCGMERAGVEIGCGLRGNGETAIPCTGGTLESVSIGIPADTEKLVVIGHQLEIPKVTVRGGV